VETSRSKTESIHRKDAEGAEKKRTSKTKSIHHEDHEETHLSAETYPLPEGRVRVRGQLTPNLNPILSTGSTKKKIHGVLHGRSRSPALRAWRALREEKAFDVESKNL